MSANSILVDWQPTKFVPHSGGWRASRDLAEVSAGSRLVSDIFARSYASLVSQHAHGSLLDHGCGKSPLFGLYRDLISDVTMIDWSNSPHKPAHLDIVCDLNEPMPLPDKSFDTVLSSDVVEHLWNPLAAFAEIARVLKPGGKLIVGTPFNYWLHEQPHDYFRWSPHAIVRIGDEVGLDVVTILRVGGMREVLADTFLKTVQPVFGATLTGYIDSALRWSGFVSHEPRRDQAMTLGTVSVLQRRTD